MEQKKMNMISTGAFLNEMDASDKQQTLAERFAAVWEKKNAKAARAGGVSLMALSLAACGSSSDDDDGGEISTPVQSSSLTVSADNFSTTAATITAARDYTPGGNDLVNSLQTDDVIKGSASVAQEMVITFGNNNDAGAATVAPTISNVETITFNNVSSNGAVDTLDMGKVSDATAVNVTSLDDNTVIRGMDNSGIALKASSVSDESSDVVFEFDTDATGMAGTGTNVSLAIDGFLGDAIAIGAGATTTDAGVEVAGTGVDKITMTSSGDASVVNSIASTNVTEFDITATADTTITGVTALGVTTVNMASSAGVTTSIDVALNANANNAFHYTGGAGDDTLRIDTNFQGGAVEVADDLRGGEGDDTLRVDVLAGATTIGALDENSAAVVQGFEAIQLVHANTIAGTTTTDMDFFSGATSIDITMEEATNVVQLNDVTDGQAGDIDWTITTGGAAGAYQINVDLKDGFGTVALGTAETLDLDVTLGLDAQTLTINDDNDNIEHLNLSLNSFSTTITEDTGSFETSFTITGGGAGETLGFNAAISSTTVDFGGVASDITMIAGGTTQTITTGAGDDDVTNNAGSKTVALGAGNDRFTTADSLGSAGTNIDSIDGGEGTDILEFTADMTDTAAGLSTVRNFEVLDLNSAASDSINMANFTNNAGFTRIDFGDAGGAGTLAITNAGSSITDIRLNAGIGADTATFARLVDTATDVLTISSRADLDGVGVDMVAFTANDEETINISGSAAANDIDLGALNATDMTTLNVSGAADLDTGAISSLALATIDASSASGALVMNAALSNAAMTVTLNANTGGAVTLTTGDGADTITGGSGIDTIVAGAGADNITGGGAADIITGGLGSDTMNGGAGADDFLYTNTLDGGTTGDVITGFVSTSDDIIIDGALETAVDLAAGAAGLVTVTQTTAGTAIAAQLETTEMLFLDTAMNQAETNSVTAAELTNLTSVAALVDEAFTQADAGAVVARTIVVAIESADTAGTFGLYTYVQSSATDVTFDAAEFSLLAVVTGDDIVAGDITF